MEKNDAAPIPIHIELHKKSHQLEIRYESGEAFFLSCEFLRVHSPSAEVQGHGPGQDVLQIDKEKVNITKIAPVGQYAVALHFDDGHNTGLYSWSWLYHLGRNEKELWSNYLAKLKQAGHERKATATD